MWCLQRPKSSKYKWNVNSIKFSNSKITLLWQHKIQRKMYYISATWLIMMRVFILAKVMQPMRDQPLPIQGIKNLEWD